MPSSNAWVALAAKAKNAVVGRPLTDTEKRREEYLSAQTGMDLNDVRVHEIPWMQLTGRAGMVPAGSKTNIFVDTDYYPKNKRVLDHELTHIFQNRYNPPAATNAYPGFDRRNYELPSKVTDVSRLGTEQQATLVAGQPYETASPADKNVAKNFLRDYGDGPKLQASHDYSIPIEPVASHESTLDEDKGAMKLRFKGKFGSRR